MTLYLLLSCLLSCCDVNISFRQSVLSDGTLDTQYNSALKRVLGSFLFCFVLFMFLCLYLFGDDCMIVLVP